MRQALFATILTANLTVNGLSHASPQLSKAGASGTGPGKTEVVGTVIRSNSDVKRVFTYFPYPDIPAQYRFAKISGTGVYRLTVDPEGKVTEVKILRRMGVFGGWPADVTALKTLIRGAPNPVPPEL